VEEEEEEEEEEAEAEEEEGVAVSTWGQTAKPQAPPGSQSRAPCLETPPPDTTPSNRAWHALLATS